MSFITSSYQTDEVNKNQIVWSLIFSWRQYTIFYDNNFIRILRLKFLKQIEAQKQSSRGVLRKKYSQKFCKIHRKTPVPESLFNKVEIFKSSLFLLKKRLWHRCFPVNFAKFLRTPFFTEQLWWLLLEAEIIPNMIYFSGYQ